VFSFNGYRVYSKTIIVNAFKAFSKQSLGKQNKLINKHIEYFFRQTKSSIDHRYGIFMLNS